MCLTTIQVNKKPKPEGEGWKVFGIIRDREERIRLRGVYHTTDPISTTAWNKTDISKKIGNGLYNAGWHIFKTEEGAKRMMLDPVLYSWRVVLDPVLYSWRVVLRVRYRGAHTEGTQWPEAKAPDSIVAEEFQIIEGQKLTWREINII